MPDPAPPKIFRRVVRVGGFGRAAKRPPAHRLTRCAPIRHRDWRRRAAPGMFPAMSDHPGDLRLAFRAARTGTTGGPAPGYEQADILDLWRDDLITFAAIGCSHTFERPLMASGIPLRQVEQRRKVSMRPLPLVIGRAPGSMLVTDVRSAP